MQYNLNDIQAAQKGEMKFNNIVRKFSRLITGERKNLWFALLGIIINAALTLIAPLLIGITIDRYVTTKNMHGVLMNAAELLIIYIVAFGANYLQMLLMGKIGQRMMYRLRNAVFSKLQELPVDFFNQNKAGDLISRINNDTQKLNQFFSQSLTRFIGSLVMVLGAGTFLISIHPKLGGAALVPALGILLFTKIISPWVKRKNASSLKSVGNMSGDIQESLDNFKAIIAFNRRDYFRSHFEEANQTNYKKAIGAGIANTLLAPVYALFTNLAKLVVLTYGIYLIGIGNFTIGFLISFLSYTNSFYSPLRQMATLWASFQAALAAWDRISFILSLKSNMKIKKNTAETISKDLLEFKNVYFSYDGGKDILQNVNFNLQRGKTYAFIGPTGGGKTTNASLIARLYDPTQGHVFLQGKDIRSFTEKERTDKIGFILQEPFLFNGTLKENILLGNERYDNTTEDELLETLKALQLDRLLEKFDHSLQTEISTGANSLSLGQKQLVAFIRAVLRKPDLLILDEATANIDTVTEQLLEEMLKYLPDKTTLVIIAHRLNTIENADEIFFINGGNVTEAGSMENAMDLLMNQTTISK